jgi:oxygen-independent coproporphyrinogen-3 oxidase
MSRPPHDQGVTCEISLYVHIPYCRSKCRYCSFYSVHGDEADYDVYMRALANEWRLLREEAKLDDPAIRIASIYVGGGTPSVLGAARLTAIYAILRDGPAWSETCEVTLEVGPESVTLDLVRTALETGYNRVSVGAQSFDDETLELLGRSYAGERVREALRDVRAAGCTNLSIDLSYGLPTTRLETWRAGFREALTFEPQHLSGYLLTPEEETLLHQLLRASTSESPLDEDAFRQYEALRTAMRDAGYDHYELSNFCKPGHRCRHHEDIWQRRPYYGLGPSAHSFDGEVRWCNAPDLADYVGRLIDSPHPPRREHYRLSPEDAARESILLGLRRAEGLTWQGIATLIDEAALQRLQRRAQFLVGTGFMEVDEQGFRLAPRAYFVASHVIMDLLEALTKRDDYRPSTAR